MNSKKNDELFEPQDDFEELTSQKLNNLLVFNLNKIQMSSSHEITEPLRSSVKLYEEDITDELAALASLIDNSLSSK